ncbi:MAG: hypothetical protein ACRD5H_07230 [Nitrososphaerales archaeon]
MALVLLTYGNVNYFPISQDSTSENTNLGDLSTTDEEHISSNNHGESNVIDNIAIAYWTGFAGLGAFVSGLVIHRWIEHLNRIQLFKYLIAVLAFTTGIIHILLIQEHLKESLIYGIFFAVSGSALIAYGSLVSRFHTRNIVYHVGIAGTVALIALYLFTRLVTLPFSTEGGVEAISALDIITKIVEAMLLVVLVYSCAILKASRQLTAKR